MRKRYLSLMSLLFGVIVAGGQDMTRQDVDSMRKVLAKTKQGIDRVDLLLNLAQFYIFKPGESEIDFDSARVYINEAKALNRSVKSSAAYGYQLLTESYLNKERGHKDESEKMVEEAITILKAGNNKDYLGQAYYELSMYYEYNDSLQCSKKLALIKQSSDAFQQAGNLKGKARNLEMLGDLYSVMDEYPKAISTLNEAKATYDSIKYPKLQGVYVLLGAAYMYEKDYGQALFYLLRALKTAQTLQDTSIRLCQINNHLGILYGNIDRQDMALKYLGDALETAKKYNDEFSILLLAINMSGTYNDLEQPGQSLKVLSNIPKKYFVSDNPFEKSLVNINYFRTFLNLKQFGNAQPYRDTILQLADKKLVTEERRSNIYRLIANYYFLASQYSKAQYYLTKSIDIVKRTNYEFGHIQDLRLSYKLDSAQGNFGSAFHHLLLFKAKTDSVSSERKFRQFQVLNVEYDLGIKEDSIKLKEKDISLLTRENSLQQANLRQASLIKNVTVAGIVLALIIIGLLYRQYRRKQKNNQVITQKNEQLQHYLDEKEWLLKEIHHRVKNNLQIVMSLLNSQSAYIDNEPALTAIHDSQRRVQAMSLIHQKLYGSENVSSINMSSYIRELVSYLSDSFNTGQRIRFELNIESLELDVSQAVPVGLILNEAITNSIKYAFPDNRNGFISISLTNSALQHYLLVIADNGIGMPAHLAGKKPGSLGMSLMAGLSEDLGGSFTIENNNGTTIRISFILDQTVKRPDILAASFINSN